MDFFGNHIYIVMKIRIFLLLLYLPLCGCVSSQRRVHLDDAESLLAAAKNLLKGDTHHEVVYFLGWRKDSGAVGAQCIPIDDPGGGKIIHPDRYFWRWQIGRVSLYVYFTHDARVYEVLYYDGRSESEKKVYLIKSS